LLTPQCTVRLTLPEIETIYRRYQVLLFKRQHSRPTTGFRGNRLGDGNGHKVKLKEGGEVDVKIEADQVVTNKLADADESSSSKRPPYNGPSQFSGVHSPALIAPAFWVVLAAYWA
jgi:hypothetical protein